MLQKEPSNEATLGEVLSEVTLADVGRKLKKGAGLLGCYAVFLIVILAITSVGKSTGYDLDQLGIPSWIIWLLLAWVYVYGATSERSFHTIDTSWYFPKLKWFGSLVLAAYLVGFAYGVHWVSNMDEGVERGIWAMLVWVGYTSPFILFLSIISVGHDNLMKKRRAAAA